MGDVFKRIREDINQVAKGASYVEIYGKKELMITGCSSLLDFDDRTVCVKTVNGDIVVRGEGLSICAFRADLLCVCGKIFSVELSEDIC